MIEIGKPYYQLEAIDGDFVYASAIADTALEANQDLVRRLAALTKVRGIQISSKAIVQGEIGWKIWRFKFPQQHLDSRPLIF